MQFYTEMQVGVGSFLGSPLAGGILMSRNAKVAGDLSHARRIIVISILATAGVIALGIVLGLILPQRSGGNYLIPLLGAWAMRLWYRRVQGDYLTTRFPDSARASWWRTIGISLLVAVVLLALLFGAAYIYVVATEQA